jgi:hypothetical protein
VLVIGTDKRYDLGAEAEQTVHIRLGFKVLTQPISDAAYPLNEDTSDYAHLRLGFLRAASLMSSASK